MGDPITALVISSLSSLAGYTVLHSINIFKNTNNLKLTGLYLPYGKTKLCENMNRNNENRFFIDLDEILKNIDEKKYDELIKDDVKFLINFIEPTTKYLLSILRNFKKKKIVVVSSNLTLLTELQITNRTFLPSEKFLENQAYDDELKKLIYNKKLECAAKKIKIRVYNSYQDLYEQIRKKYNLKQILNL